MKNEPSASPALWRVAFAQEGLGSSARRELSKFLGASAPFLILDASMPTGGQGSAAERARSAGANIFIQEAEDGSGHGLVSILAPADSAMEMKRKERPFLAPPLTLFLFRGESIPAKIADFLICYFALESGRYDEAMERAQAHEAPPFIWIKASALLWRGSFKAAFAAFNQIGPPEDENPAETGLFKAAFAAGGACLVELTRTPSLSGPAIAEERISALFTGLLDGMDPSQEPDLAAMAFYNLGLAVISRSAESAISWLRKAHELSPAIPACATAACRALLAEALSQRANASQEQRAALLSEADSLLTLALEVYLRDQFPGQYISAQRLKGQVLLDLSEYAAGKARVQILSSSIEAFSLALEALEEEGDGRWIECMLGLCGALTALGASVGGQRGEAFVDEAMALLDSAEPGMAPAMERVQICRASAMMVKRLIQKSMGINPPMDIHEPNLEMDHL